MKRLSYKKQIKKIMDEFNFEKVQWHMQATHWCWRGGGVPDVPKLKACALDLLTNCRKKNGCSYATGGFVASCRKRHLTLSFQVEEADGYEHQ